MSKSLLLEEKELELLEHIVYFYKHQYEEDTKPQSDCEIDEIKQMMELHLKIRKLMLDSQHK